MSPLRSRGAHIDKNPKKSRFSNYFDWAKNWSLEVVFYCGHDGDIFFPNSHSFCEILEQLEQSEIQKSEIWKSQIQKVEFSKSFDWAKNWSQEVVFDCGSNGDTPGSQKNPSVRI